MTNDLLNEDLSGLLREARDNAIASTAEEDISGGRRAYRRELAERLNSALASLAKPQPADSALANAAEQFIAWHKDGAPKPAMLDYFAEIFGEALAKPQPVGGALTDERIEAAFNEKDAVGNWVAGGCTMAGFKRAVRWAEARLATLSAPVAQPGEAVSEPAALPAEVTDEQIDAIANEWLAEPLDLRESPTQANRRFVRRFLKAFATATNSKEPQPCGGGPLKSPEGTSSQAGKPGGVGVGDLTSTSPATPIAAQPAAAEPVGAVTTRVKGDVVSTKPELYERFKDLPARTLLYAAPAQAAAVPEGWKLVPVEPTQEMVSAYLQANDTYWKRTDELPSKNASRWREGKPNEATAESYKAMIIAAPMAQAAAVPEAVVRDAARYQWLRDQQNDWDAFDSSWLVKQDLYGQGPDEMDAFIDEQIDRAGGQGDVSGEGEAP
jgi:hypothetical protein